ncbi:glycosyltransferase [bacterium]|nr:glycosyltransferase [bacterium]
MTLRGLRAVVPGPLREALWPMARQMLLMSLRSRLAASPRTISQGPVVVSGFLKESFGVGESARLTADALKRAGLPVATHDLRGLFERDPSASRLPAQDGGVWVLNCNPPEAIAALSRLPMKSWRSRYRIGYWAYELPRAPAEWRRAADLFDEIWTPSKFVADSITGVRTPIRVMPHPVAFVGRRPMERAPFGLPEDAFCILTAADHRSSLERKNVRGAISAYLRAFPDPDGKTVLVVKLLGAQDDATPPRELVDAAGGREDIRFMVADLPRSKMQALIGSSDLVFSPHRSEGFGFLLAEAFAMGVPALATGWSGNVDFMSGLDPLLLPSTLTPVRDPAGVYKSGRGAVWAEPDLGVAVDRLRLLRADPDLRAKWAAAGRRRVEALKDVWSAALAAPPGWVKHVARPG